MNNDDSTRDVLFDGGRCISTGMRAARFIMAGVLLAGPAVHVANAQTPTPSPTRYLADQPDLVKLGFTLPPPPRATVKDPDARDVDLDALRSAVELDQVRAAQLVDAASRTEAFEDADSYSYDVLMPRFSAAAGRNLSITRRPILAHMLLWLVADVDFYKIKETKGQDGAAFMRTRPFVVDPAIVPCNQSYMTFPAMANRSDSSYPSGHAAHGYVAALLLAAVMPDRSGPIVARGVRYGTNRVVCGVHYPSDVATGQAFARFIVAKAIGTAAYRKDLECAAEEDMLDRTGGLPKRVFHTATATYTTLGSNYSAKCQATDAAYFQEALDRVRSTSLNLWPRTEATPKP